MNIKSLLTIVLSNPTFFKVACWFFKKNPKIQLLSLQLKSKFNLRKNKSIQEISFEDLSANSQEIYLNLKQMIQSKKDN